MKQGSSAMLIRLAIHSVRMAMAASPLPRKMPLIRNSITMARLPPRTMRAYPVPVRMTEGVACMNSSSRGAKMQPADSHQDGEHNARADRLHGGHRRAFGIVLPDAARHRRGGGHGEPHGDGEDDHDDGFGESDGSHGVGAEARHPEGVDHAEGGLHHHLQNGGNGEQGDAPGQTALREILRGAGKRFAQELPLAAGWRQHGRLHLSLSGYSDPS